MGERHRARAGAQGALIPYAVAPAAPAALLAGRTFDEVPLENDMKMFISSTHDDPASSLGMKRRMRGRARGKLCRFRSWCLRL
jgi:hypothetical protein